jgi:hypothetical protein
VAESMGKGVTLPFPADALREGSRRVLLSRIADFAAVIYVICFPSS